MKVTSGLGMKGVYLIQITFFNSQQLGWKSISLDLEARNQPISIYSVPPSKTLILTIIDRRSIDNH